LAVSGPAAVIAPEGEMHTEPLADPGRASPSPLSEVTEAVNFSSMGSAGVVPLGGFTYPGQAFPTDVTKVGAPIVVLEPEVQ
jgi:hypothetical protein